MSAKRKEDDDEARAKRIAAADLIVEVCAEYATSPGGYGFCGYAALSGRTGLSAGVLRGLRSLAQDRAPILYEGCQLIYDDSEGWRLTDRPTQAQRKRAIGHGKSAVKQCRQGERIGMTKNSTPADRLYARYMGSQADQIEMILEFAEQEMSG